MTKTLTEKRTAPATGVWAIDPSHSNLEIVARHLMVTKVRGTFQDFSGTIIVAEDPTESRVEFEARTGSVTTRTPDRDAHLRSPDFLDADNYPLITFSSTSIEPNGAAWVLTGDLTIRGVTRPVSFDLSYLGTTTDPYGNTKTALVARGAIDREQWGLTWNVPLQGGGVLVSRKFDIEFEVQAGLKA